MSRKQQDPPSLEYVTALFERGNLMKTIELAVYLRKTPDALDIMASRGTGPTFIQQARGGERLYRPADVRAWLDSRRFSATGVPLAAGEEPAA